MKRYAMRVDQSQAYIVKGLRSLGIHVEIIGQPVDLLIHWNARWHLMECKTGKRRRKDQPAQDAFMERFGVPRVATLDDALKYLGLLRMSVTT